MFPVQRKKLLEASGNSPAGLIQLEQEIKKVKQEQEQCQQMINYYKEALQRTFKEQDEGKEESNATVMSKRHAHCTYIELHCTCKTNYLASLYSERTAISSGAVFPIGVLVASTY